MEKPPSLVDTRNRAAPAPSSASTLMRDRPAARLRRSVSASIGQSACAEEVHRTTRFRLTVLLLIHPRSRLRANRAARIAMAKRATKEMPRGELAFHPPTRARRREKGRATASRATIAAVEQRSFAEDFFFDLMRDSQRVR